MVRVFILGATGFIGNPVALALRTQGHKVYGLARTEEKAIGLTKQEIIPVLGDAEKPESWLPVLDLVDIIIDSSSSPGGKLADDILQNIKKSSRVASRKPHQPKLGFIYVSGVWVHGSHETEIVTDLVPVGPEEQRKPVPLVEWRTLFEASLMASRDILDVVIARAGILYGGSGSLFSIWWQPLLESLKGGKQREAVTITGKPEAQLPLIHKDDYADAILQMVTKWDIVSQAAYPVVDITGPVETLGDINKAVANALGIVGEIKYKAPSNPFEMAMSTSLVLDNSRTRALLGWEPKHTTLKFDAELYAKAWLYSTDYRA